MQIDAGALRQHFASLSDAALLAVDRSELIEMAQKYYDEELARRRVAPQREAESLAGPDDQATARDQPAEGQDAKRLLTVDTEVDPDWLDEAACACTFADYPGGTSASDAASARDVLVAAGIPCHISVREIDPPSADPPPRSGYCLMVPGALNLLATGVLDVQIFNSTLEANWRTHFERLSDEEFQALNSEIICAGLLDHIKRLKRAYNDEIARRGLRLG